MVKVIRLTESDLHRIIENTANRIIREVADTPDGQYKVGRLAARQEKQGRTKDARNTNDYAYYRAQQSTNTPEDEDYYHNMNAKGRKDGDSKTVKESKTKLDRIIESSINTVLNEIGDTDRGKDAIAQVQGRAAARIMKDPSHAAKYQKTYNDAENRLKGQKNGKGFQKGFQKGIKEAKNDDIENGIDNDFDLYNDDGTYDYTETPDYDSLYGDMSDDDMQQYMDDADADRFINNDAYDDGESSLYDYQ